MSGDILPFIAVGFAAQMVDGAVGMVHGLTAASVLLSLGIAPATASASAMRRRSSPPAPPACPTGGSATSGCG